MSANLRFLNFSPLIFIPTFSSILLRISSIPAVNINGERVSPCLTPFCALVLLSSSCLNLGCTIFVCLLQNVDCSSTPLQPAVLHNCQAGSHQVYTIVHAHSLAGTFRDSLTHMDNIISQSSSHTIVKQQPRGASAAP